MRIKCTKQWFLESLKFYTINSTLININDAFMIGFFLHAKIWRFMELDFFDNKSSEIFYYVYIYLNLWAVLYTFGGELFICCFYFIFAKFKSLHIIGTMDILILLKRIQLIYPKLKLFRKTPVNRIAFVMLVFCFIINIPIILSRGIIKVPFKIESNETELLETYGSFFFLLLFSYLIFW